MSAHCCGSRSATVSQMHLQGPWVLLLAVLVWSVGACGSDTLPKYSNSGLQPNSPQRRAWQAVMGSMVPGVGQWTGRGLLDDGSSDAASGPPPNNCSCSQAPREDPVLQLIGYSGVLPIVKHYTHVFVQQQKARGNDAQVSNTIESFSSPDDLTPLIQQRPSYDYAIVEAKGLSGVFSVQDGTGADIFTPPDWLQGPPDSRPSTDPKNVPAALEALLFQSANLLGNRPTLLSYRRDVLAQHGLAVPETWGQLLQAAAQVNGTDMNGDNTTDYALCVDVDPECKLYWTFSTLAASILQANGTSSGYLLDPVTGEYLMRSEGMMVALRMWVQLMKYNSPEQATKAYCGLWEDAFAQGRCAFTIGTLQINGFNMAINGDTTKPYAWGRTGQAPAPGSTVVYDRTQGRMVNCSPSVCPFATPLTAPRSGDSARRPQQYVNRAPVMCRNANTQQDVRSTKATNVALRAFSEVWVIAASSWVFLSFSPGYFAVPAGQRTMMDFGVNASSVDTSIVNMTYYTSAEYLADIYDWVQQQKNMTTWLPPTSNPNVSLANSVPWVGSAALLGMNPKDIEDHLSLAVWLHAHANAVPDPQMVAPLRIAVAAAAHHMQQGLNETLILADLSYKLGLWALRSPTLWNRDLYNSDIGYKPQPTVSRKSYSSSTAAGGLTPEQLAATITVPVAVALLAAGVVAYLAYQGRMKAGFDLFGRVRPPSLGPCTTLLVTDIEQSTELWEVLPSDVMETAVQLHHAVLRDRLRQFKGYETATEGDSFIIAFHTPHDALRYCLAVQSELLILPWPQVLVRQGMAAQSAGEVHVQCAAGSMAWVDGKSRLSSPQDSMSQPWWRVWTSPRGGSLPGSRTISVSGAQLSQYFESVDGLPSERPTNSSLGFKGACRTSDTMDTTLAAAGAAGVCVRLSSAKDAGATWNASSAADSPRLENPLLTGDTLESLLKQQVWAVAPGSLLQDSLDGATAVPSRDGTDKGPVLAFRGLRVRMGLHSGLTDPHAWTINQATSRWCASGTFLAITKAVGDAGAGGMIVLSRGFWNALQPFGLPAECVVLHMGEHLLKEQESAMALYLALPTPLASRLAVFPPLRTLGLTSPSILQAPVGQAVIVFMHAVGIKALRAWNAEVTQDTLQIYHEVVSCGLLQWGGYLVELADGLCLASFTDPAAALCWTLSTQAELLTQDWDRRLLQNELCEEVAIPIAMTGGFNRLSSQLTNQSRHGSGLTRLDEVDEQLALDVSNHATAGPSFMMADVTRKKVLLRGPRIKAGIDLGDIHCRVNPATGRMTYMGKVMNRAARISNAATSSQVLCSMQAWSASCAGSIGVPGVNRVSLPGMRGMPPIVGSSHGLHALKGITEKVHLVLCTLDDM